MTVASTPDQKEPDKPFFCCRRPPADVTEVPVFNTANMPRPHAAATQVKA